MTIKVDLSGLILHEGESPIAIGIGSEEWLEWLKSAKSFRFESEAGNFTAVRVGRYWQAHKKVKGKLRREHLGLDEKLTYDLMVEIACKISSEHYREERESHKHETTREEAGALPTDEEVGSLRAENEALKERISYLLDERGLIQAKATADAQVRIEQLEKQVRDLDNANWELQKHYTVVDELCQKRGCQLGELKVELESLKGQPSVSDLIKQYETDYETIKPSLPKPPAEVTRNWVEFWRFKTWLESLQNS